MVKRKNKKGFQKQDIQIGNDSLPCVFQFRGLPPEKKLILGTLLVFYLHLIPMCYHIHTVSIRVQENRPRHTLKP